jgi:STE24 endopeptidase
VRTAAPTRATALEYFGAEEVEKARRYHRPIYWVLLADALLGLGVLGLLTAWAPNPGWWWPISAVAVTMLTVAILTAVGLPLSYWRGYLHERRFGLSTQTRRGWALDRAKGLGVGLVLSVATVTGLIALARAFPTWWPLPAAAAAALLVLLLGFVAPLVLEPLFNKFEPLLEEPLAGELRGLAERAGVPVAAVLVADASRRTRKSNAYVSGLGRTRRVVLWDTLLHSSSPREVKLVVAHELGHRRERHVAKFAALGMLGSTVVVLMLWVVLGSDLAEPRFVPRILLVSGVLELIGLPFTSWVSRRWERVADRFSLDLTRDPEAFREAHKELALANLSDLDPPPLVYALLFSHPTPPERLAAAAGMTLD